MNTTPWWETEWYQEWEKLAEKDYHGKREVKLFGYERRRGPFTRWKRDGPVIPDMRQEHS